MKRLLAAMAVIFVLFSSCDNLFHGVADKHSGDQHLLVIGEDGARVVKFDSNGGDTAAEPGTITVWSPAETTGRLPSNPEKKGYTFAGWYPGSDGSGTRFTSSTKVSADITVYAKWSRNTYTVTFDANGAGGTVPPPETVEAGWAIFLPEPDDLVYDDCIFGGWNTTWDGSGDSYNSSEEYFAGGTITLYAMWIPNTTETFTVSFETNGGSVTGSQIVAAGSAAKRPAAAPVQTHFRFIDWYGDAELLTPYDFSTPVSADIILYAKWERLVYTVKYDSSGASGAVPSDETVEAGSTITLNDGAGLSKEARDFGGWTPRADGHGIAYSGGSFYVPTADITLYARWNAAGTVTHTVNFDTDGGSEIASQIVVEGHAAVHPVETPLKMRFTFAGWYGDAGTLSVPYAFSATPLTQDITVYAKWEHIRYTVTYNLNRAKGTEPPAETVNAGSSVTIPGQGDIARIGYAFGGWNALASGKGKNYSEGELFEPRRNTILHAKWTPIHYTVRYDKNAPDASGPAMPETVFTYDVPQRLARNSFSREGYNFAGWAGTPAAAAAEYTDGQALKNLSSVEGGVVTLYAVWISGRYTVSFYTGGGSSVPSQTVDYGSGASRPSPDPTRPYSVFTGWYSDFGATVPYDFSTPVTRDIIVYAGWNISQYTVKYDAGGGSGTAPVQEPVSPGTSITVAGDNGLTRTGFTFGGWIASGTGTVYPAGSSYTVNGDTVFYAKWDPVPVAVTYTVTFSANGGSGTPPAPLTAAPGSVITLPGGDGLTSLYGHNFAGWTDDGNGNNYTAGSSYTVNGDITLSALWEPK